MTVNLKVDGGMAIAALSGEIDLASSPEVRSAILRCLGKGSPLLVDLSQVAYIDSSGIASLVEGYQAARGKELAFGLTGATEAVMRVFKLARLDRVFPFFESVAEFREHVR